LFLLGRSGRKSVSLPALRATCYNPGVDCRVPCFRGCFAKNVSLEGRPRKHAGFAKLACFRGSFALDSRFGNHPRKHGTPSVPKAKSSLWDSRTETGPKRNAESSHAKIV